METVRDLSFDYAERVQGDKCGEFGYNKTLAVSIHSSCAAGGYHYHFWVPPDMTSHGYRQTKLAEALVDAKKRFTVTSASWDFIPVTAKRSPSQKHIQHKELFLIDWRQTRRASHFEIVEMTNTTEWICGALLTFDEVNSILKRGDVTIRIQLPPTYKREAK